MGKEKPKPLTSTQRFWRPLAINCAQAAGSFGVFPCSSGVFHRFMTDLMKFRSRWIFGCVAGSTQYGPFGAGFSPGLQARGPSEGSHMKREMLPLPTFDTF